ncbi:MAG TPA: YihY/virulence factor BrkB family protein, partial [Flavisolibacter sp.]
MAIRARIQKRLTSSHTGRFIISGSKRIYLPGFYGFSMYEVLPPFIRQLRKTSIPERASGISFNIVMAIPPMLIFVFTLIPYLPISQQFIDQLFNLIRDLVPGEKDNSAIIGFLDDFINQERKGLLSFGLLMAVIFSSNAMFGILRAFDKNYPGFRKRKGINQRALALKITLTTMFMVFLCVSLLIAQSEVLAWLGVESVWLRELIDYSRWFVIIFIVFYIVSYIYRHGPAIAQKWPYLTPGSVFATTLMVVSTALFTWWVNNFSN